MEEVGSLLRFDTLLDHLAAQGAAARRTLLPPAIVCALLRDVGCLPFFLLSALLEATVLLPFSLPRLLSCLFSFCFYFLSFLDSPFPTKFFFSLMAPLFALLSQCYSFCCASFCSFLFLNVCFCSPPHFSTIVVSIVPSFSAALTFFFFLLFLTPFLLSFTSTFSV